MKILVEVEIMQGDDGELVEFTGDPAYATACMQDHLVYSMEGEGEDGPQNPIARSVEFVKVV
jgi:hypothetical protein